MARGLPVVLKYNVWSKMIISIFNQKMELNLILHITAAVSRGHLTRHLDSFCGDDDTDSSV